MRTDYGLYALAIICFIIAALPYYYTNVIPADLLRLDYFASVALTVIFAALGLISIILGYSQRPKPTISIPEAPKPAIPPSPHALPSTEEAITVPSPVPTPSTPPKEEITKPEREKPKTRRKRTTRRKKKA